MLEAPLEQVNKIKLLKDKIELHYRLVNGADGGFKFPEEARREFFDAMADLLSPALDLLELPKAYASRMHVSGISFTWKNDIMGAVITLQKELNGTDAPLVLNTPFLPEAPFGEGENKLLPDALVRGLRECLVETELYLKGERKQGQLPLKVDQAEAAVENRENELQLN